jgi:CDP-diacylglycerol---serine O-phosphatidyltransferase
VAEELIPPVPRFIRFLPNAITLAAMGLGLTALRLSYVREDIYLSLLLLLIAAFLDGIDGKIARKLNVQSPVGAQLDSLADFLNFCVTPALIIYEWHLKSLYFFGWAATLCFLTGGAYRLARFNVMHSKGIENVSSNFFVGVPTPAGAILAFLPMVLTLKGYLTDPSGVWTAIYMVAVSGLMVSYIKTPSNKLVRVSRKHVPYALAGLVVFGAAALYSPMDLYLVAIGVYLGVTLVLFFRDDPYRKRKH